MLPLAVEEVEADPSLRMLELKGSLYLPLDMLAWSPSGVNMFCRGIASPLAAAACLRAYGIVGRVGVRFCALAVFLSSRDYNSSSVDGSVCCTVRCFIR